MEVIKTDIKDLYIIETQVFKDNRGWFMESYSAQKFKEKGLDIEFIQDNHSLSKEKGVLRGLHFQLQPKAQTKLVRCIRGKIYDVAVDLREGSPTYKKWFGVELSAENKKQFLIPKGFAHGFLTLSKNTEVQYKVDEYYAPQYDRSIKYNDPEINVEWNIDNFILSDKDKNAPLLKDSDVNFKY